MQRCTKCRTWNYKTTKAVKYLSFDPRGRYIYSNTSLFKFSLSSVIITSAEASSSPGTVFMTTSEEALFFAVCLEWFFYGKISVPSCAFTCTLAKRSPITLRSRTLFWNIRHVFTLLIEQVQDGNHPFLRSLSSLRSIYCYRCQWFTGCHTPSK